MRVAKHSSCLILTAFSIVGVLFLTGSISTRAQSPTSTIVGAVIDAQTGVSVENASVAVIGIETTRAVTDSSGNFAAPSIPVAEPFLQVTISITASGYGSWTMRDTLLYPNITMTLTARLTQQDQLIVVGAPRAFTGSQPSPIDSQPTVPRAPSYFSNNVPPATIRVAITPYANCGDWLNNGKPVIRVDTVDFRAYAKNVLPNEWPPSWGNNAADSLRAGAMAVKMFAWWRVNIGGRPAQNADVVDNTCDQRYVQGVNYFTTDVAVDLTWFYRMRRNGQVIEIHYLATIAQCQASSLQPCMPQEGTYNDALAGMNWQAILHKYYDPVLIDGFGFWYYFPIIRR